jgi:pimeloyl-ACP methyl ester carboxylesterase
LFRNRIAALLITVGLQSLFFAYPAYADESGVTSAKHHRPVVLLLHAGGWMFGDTSLTEPLEPIARRAGFKPVEVDYTIGSLPSAFEDAEKAARQYRDRAVYAYGESAGGTMAGWLASQHLVAAAAGNSAVVNIRAFLRPFLNSTEVITLPQGDTTVGEFMLKVAGGMSFIRTHTLQRLHGSPLRLYGNCDDGVVPCETSMAYAARFPSVTWRLAGSGHIADSKDTARRAMDWFTAIDPR